MVCAGCFLIKPLNSHQSWLAWACEIRCSHILYLSFVDLDVKKYSLTFLFLCFWSCEENYISEIDKSTFHDDIGDISFLHGSVFTTNYDMSGNSGQQIELIKLELLDEISLLDDKFELEINGQGYLTMTNDGTNLFLQSRSTQLIFQISKIGEIGFFKYDDSLSTNWLPSGVSYDSLSDSLIFLYRNQHDNNSYLLKLTSKSISGNSSRSEVFVLNNIDTASHGVYAIEYANPNLYLLAVNDNQEDVLITMDYETLSLLSAEIISDSTVVGLSVFENSIYFGYRDKRIQKYKDI